MSGSGRGGNSRRRPYKNRERNGGWQRDDKKKADKPRFDKSRGVIFERPQWTPPPLASEPLPSPVCPYCGAAIKDISTAVTDKNSGEAVHFDCVMKRIAENESLDQGDTIAYIGGGRFGIVHYSNPQEKRTFKIKKILEWEDRENRAGWRMSIADHYSLT